MQRVLDVFFYGLFMDREALLAQGLHAGPARLASVEGFRLHIGERATLLPEARCTVWGVVMSLPGDEIGQLYGAPSVADYRPEAVLARLEDGAPRAALCYNLPADALAGTNRDYAVSLHALSARLALPDEYQLFLAKLAE